MIDIILVLNSARISAADLPPVVAALNRQIEGDFAPLWGIGGTVYIADGPAGAAKFYLQDGLDDPGALGYHIDENGLISAKIDIQGCQLSGSDWRTCLGHEAVEALADPLCNRLDPVFNRFLVETADPVEENEYVIDGIPVTNFVTPSYFGFDQLTRYDFNRQLIGNVSSQNGLLPGGYQTEYVGGQWVSHMARKVDGSFSWMATRPTGRSAFRASQGVPLLP